MTYDRSRLAKLGRQRKKLLDQLDELRDLLTPEVIAAELAEVPQKEIAELTYYTRETIRRMCLTPEQREEEDERRRQRTRKSA